MGATTAATVDAIRRGDLRAAARLITRIEAGDPDLDPTLEALHALGGKTPVIGITGPPGAGKSTLVDQMLAILRQLGRRIAVLAVDPSSPYSGGAILGDRVRMGRHNTDPGVFIRSMAARGQLGGLSPSTGDALTVLDAMNWDLILVETVGVGQSEVNIVRHAHTVVIVQTPSGGDIVQAVKAGLLEVGDIFVVNKADGGGADRTVSALREAVELRTAALTDEVWQPPILKTQAVEGSGVDQLMQTLLAHRSHLEAHPVQAEARTKQQSRALLVERIADVMRLRYGHGLPQADRIDRLVDEIVARRRHPRSAALSIVDALI